MDKMTKNFHIVDFLIGVAMALVYISTNYVLKTISLVLLLFLYSTQIAIVQINRKNGTIIAPFVLFLIPKKIRERIFENM